MNLPVVLSSPLFCVQVQRLQGKYLRADSYRKALVYQKKYILLLLGGFQGCEQTTLALIARKGAYPSPEHLHTTARHGRPFTVFRSAARVVVTVSRSDSPLDLTASQSKLKPFFAGFSSIVKHVTKSTLIKTWYMKLFITIIKARTQ